MFPGCAKIPINGYIVTAIYMVTKFCYLISCVVQYISLGAFLGLNVFSTQARYNIQNASVYHASQLQAKFPRVVVCDFEVRPDSLDNHFTMMYPCI